MRHRKRRTKLSMMRSHRKATVANMAKSLIAHQKINTTLRRAKEARRLVEHLITVAKTDSIAARREAFRILRDEDLVTKLFKEVAPLFKERPSGYTRIIRLGFRRGDGSNLAILELTEKKLEEKLAKKKARKEKAAAAKLEEKKAHAEKTHEEKEAKKEEPKAKHVPKSKPTLDEEKRTEKAKIEDKKIADKKGFMKNLRGFFRRKTDM